MGTEQDRPSGAAGGRVFELTMDNPEDQDELNRRLRKPGETPAKVKGTAPGESATDSTNSEPIHRRK